MSDRLSIPDTAATLECSQRTVWRLLKEGKLTPLYLRGRTYVHKGQVERLDQEGTRKEKPPERKAKKRAGRRGRAGRVFGVGDKSK